MTEQELRKLVVDLALRYEGIVQGSPEHHLLIDAYNSWFAGHYPDNWKAQYSDSWCMEAVDAWAIMARVISVVPNACDTKSAVNITKTYGEWHGRDYIPQPADLIFFDWACDGLANHVGYVVSATATEIVTIEGNSKNNECRSNVVAVGDPRILGYCVPNYKSLCEPASGFPFTGIVQTAVNLRTSPKNLGPLNYCNIEAPAGTPIRHVLRQGEKVKVIGEQGNWWQVEINGAYTWTPWCAKYDGKNEIIKRV